MLGPLIVAAVLATGMSYRAGFGILLIPALTALGLLIAAWRAYPRPSDLDSTGVAWPGDGRAFPRVFWVYLAAAAAIAAGYADFPLIAYHFGRHNVVPAEWIPVLYAVAMGVDAVAALVFGRLFDRFGIPVLIAATLLSAPFAPLVFQGSAASAVAGMALWVPAWGSRVDLAGNDRDHGSPRTAGHGLWTLQHGLRAGVVPRHRSDGVSLRYIARWPGCLLRPAQAAAIPLFVQVAPRELDPAELDPAEVEVGLAR